MFLDRETLKDSLVGLVGMHQTSNPEYPLLSDSLLDSRSNRYMQDAHAGILTIENIDQSSKNFDHYNYIPYDGLTTYSKYEKVEFGGINYEYTNDTPSVGNTPPNTTYWNVINPLSDYLSRLYRQAVDEVLDGWINTKKIREKVTSISENILLFDGIANRKDVIVNADQFVGLRVSFIDERSITAIINSIGTQFDSDVTDLPIRIFHSSQNNEIGQVLISSPATSSKWTRVTTDIKTLRYLDYDLFVGGEYYIGYRQSDLESQGARALRKDIVWRQIPSGCKSCNRRSTGWYNTYSKYLDITGFQINETDMMGTANFNPDNVPYTLGNNYGLNLNLSIKCDLTQFVIQEQDILSEAIQLMWAKKVLEGIAATTRQGNEIANVIKEQARKELFNHKDAWGTLHDRAMKAMKGVEFDMSSLSEDCLPCDYKGDDAMLGTTTLR